MKRNVLRAEYALDMFSPSFPVRRLAEKSRFNQCLPSIFLPLSSFLSLVDISFNRNFHPRRRLFFFDAAFGFSFFSFLYHRLIFAIILRQIPCSCFSQFFPSVSDFCLFIFRCFAARFPLIPLPRVSSLVFASVAASSSRIP